MKIRTIRRESIFIPKFNGNRDLPKDEQITVQVKSFPTVTEAQTYKSFRFSQDSAIEVVYNSDALMLQKHIGKIMNIELDGDHEPVISGASLAKTQALELNPLISEIREYLLETAEELTEGEN
jgi:hypothetical protein